MLSPKDLRFVFYILLITTFTALFLVIGNFNFFPHKHTVAETSSDDSSKNAISNIGVTEEKKKDEARSIAEALDEVPKRPSSSEVTETIDLPIQKVKSAEEAFTDVATKAVAVTTKKVIPKTTRMPQKKVPLILGWNWFFTIPPIWKQYMLNTCPTKCTYTLNKGLLDKVDVVVFHAGTMPTNYKKLPQLRPDQLKLMFMIESPGRYKRSLYFGWNSIPMSYFNSTMIYQREANYRQSYGLFEPIRTKEDPQWSEDDVERAVNAKEHGAFFLASHCGAESNRDQVVFALANITKTPLGIFGGCGKTCTKQCEADLVKTYHFYLAFENSVCRDYVTEKFFRMKRLIVPIVLKRSVMGNIAPADSFIAVDDFCSLEQLVEHMEFLMTHKEEYRKYFAWTRRLRSDNRSHALCDFCRDLVMGNVSTTVFPEKQTIRQFLSADQCFPTFGTTLVQDRCGDSNETDTTGY